MKTPKSTNDVRRILTGLGAKHPPSIEAVRLVSVLVVTTEESKFWEIKFTYDEIRFAVEQANHVSKEESIRVFADALHQGHF